MNIKSRNNDIQSACNKALINISIILTFLSLSLHSLTQTINPKIKINNSIDSSGFSMYSFNDTLNIDNENLKILYSPANSNILVVTSSGKSGTTLLIALADSNKTHVLWYSDAIDHFELIDFNKDQVDELLVETENAEETMISNKMYILSLDRSAVDTLFQMDGYHFRRSAVKNISPLSKSYFYTIKDYNKDHLLDLKVKTIRKYKKDRKCDCDKDYFYRIKKQYFYFKEGGFNE